MHSTKCFDFFTVFKQGYLLCEKNVNEACVLHVYCLCSAVLCYREQIKNIAL